MADFKSVALPYLRKIEDFHATWEENYCAFGGTDDAQSVICGLAVLNAESWPELLIRDFEDAQSKTSDEYIGKVPKELTTVYRKTVEAAELFGSGAIAWRESDCPGSEYCGLLSMAFSKATTELHDALRSWEYY